MIFETREDVEVPIDFVFMAVSDFRALERQAMRRGAEVRRHEAEPGADAGALPGWDIVFRFRGRQRRIRASVRQIDRPNGYTVDAKGEALQGQVVVDLLPLSRHRTRIAARIDLRPASMRGRLIVEMMRLGRPRLNRRLRRRVADYARSLEERFRREGAVG